MAQDSKPFADAAPVELDEKFQDNTDKRLKGIVYWLTLIYGAFGIAIAVNQTFNIGPFGFVLLDNSYYYILIAIFLSLAFLIFPAFKRHKEYVPFYDWLMFALTNFAGFYLAYHGGEMVERGWDTVAPMEPTIVAALMCFLALEGVRRAGGLILFAVCIVFFTFPLWTEYAPGFL